MCPDIIALMEEYEENGFITCEECGNRIEIDNPKCPCGWENPIYLAGLV